MLTKEEKINLSLLRIFDYDYCEKALDVIDKIEAMEDDAEYVGDPPLSVQEMLNFAYDEKRDYGAAAVIGTAVWLIWEGHNLYKYADQILSLIYQTLNEEFPCLHKDDAKFLIKALASPQHTLLFCDLI